MYAGGEFTEAGSVTVNNIARWDGDNWHALGSGVNGRVKALIIGSDGYLYAGGDFIEAGGVTVNNIARWDGSDWHALGSGVNDPNYLTVQALATDGNGDLYAGGSFTDAGGITVNNIARWDGSGWHALGSGVSGGVTALAAEGDGNLYVGGWFTLADGITVNNIARWDGSSWHALGSGIGDWGSTTSAIYAVAMGGNGELFAGGGFSFAGGVLASSIASWDGSNWSALRGSSWQGVGRSDETGGLAHDGNSNLYMAVERIIAHWDDSSWQVLAQKLTWVYALATDGDGNLFAGGTVSESEGVSAHYLARWDGSNWHALGSGVSGGVTALATDGDGNLYAGGWFTEAGGVAVSNVARWDGSSWHALGDGVNGEVLALATDGNGNLYAGGGFTEAGSATVNHIARWDGSNCHALGRGLDRPDNVGVCCLALDGDDNLYVGGTFRVVGGKPAVGIALWTEVIFDHWGYLPLTMK